MAGPAFQRDPSSRLAELIREANRLGVDVAGQSEDGIRRAVREAWLQENRGAIEAWNAWVADHGLPLAKYRTF
jgi:antitoxin CcdA